MTFKHLFIKTAAIACLSLFSIEIVHAQDSTQNLKPQTQSQSDTKGVKDTFTEGVKSSGEWTGQTAKKAKSKLVGANKHMEALQNKALPLRQKLQSKIPKGNVPGENMFQSIMKKTSAPAVFIGLAFAFAVWILGFATSPGRD